MTRLRRPRSIPARRVILVLLVLAGGVVAFLLARQVVGHYLRRAIDARVAGLPAAIEKKTGLYVAFGGIDVTLGGNVVVRDLVVCANRYMKHMPLLRAARVELDVRARWRRPVEIIGVTLDRPALLVELYPDGGTNLPAHLLNSGASLRDAAGTDPPTEFLGGAVKVADPLPVAFDGGELQVSDQGRFDLRPSALLRLARCSGDAALDLARRAVESTGVGAQSQGGKVSWRVAITPTAAEITATARDLRLADLAAAAPDMVHLDQGATLEGEVTLSRAAHDPWRAALDVRVREVTLEHHRLARTPVRHVAAGLRGSLTLDPQGRTLTGRDLVVSLGDAPVRVPALIWRGGEDTPFLFDAAVDVRDVPLQQLLDGVPADLIPVIAGARVEGNLELTARLLLDAADVKRSGLEIAGDVPGFRAVSVPTACDVRRIKSEKYVHHARKNGVEVKTIILGPDNPDFMPLDAVGPLVRGAVLTCEDGSFTSHHGFRLNHINDSIRRDLREKRFARGASTISMQLVKNLFLDPDKTLSRKLQEVMLTWWMEREVDKSRMLEVYFNIIEWGPKIYGVGPAARHYFHRAPSKLSPVQAAWLASIIANPVRYYYMKSAGQISEHWRTSLAFIMTKMVERGTITADDFAAAEAANFEVDFNPLEKKKDDAPPAGEKPDDQSEPSPSSSGPQKS